MTELAMLHEGETQGGPRPMIVADGAHVTYKVYASGKKMSPRETLFSTSALRGGRDLKSIHALRGVSFTASEGESIGVIGHNGSGKSTLFRAMSGLLPTSQGEIWARDRPVLLGVNAALVPELSGENNIKLGLLAMGFTPEEAAASVEEIADFAELNEFLYHPMRTYSSGMAARLRFAIASARPHSILLIDEALSVGDRRFKVKSEERIRELSASAGLVMIVSHSINALKDTCERVMWIHKGELVADGSADDVIDEYVEWTKQPGGAVGAASAAEPSAVPKAPLVPKPAASADVDDARTIGRRKRFRLAGQAGERRRLVALCIAVGALLLAVAAGAAIAMLTNASAQARTSVGSDAQDATTPGPVISGFTLSAASASCATPNGIVQVPLNWMVDTPTRVALGIGGREVDAFAEPLADNLPPKGVGYSVDFPCSEASRVYTLVAENAAGGRSSSVVIVSRTLLSDKPTPSPTPTPTLPSTPRSGIKPQPAPSSLPAAPAPPVESPQVDPPESTPSPTEMPVETPSPEIPSPEPTSPEPPLPTAEPEPSPSTAP